MADTVVPGTLEMLVLKALHLGPMHGWGITELIESTSRNTLRLKQGSLYPALYRMEREGLVKSAVRATENNREARYYSITPAGRRRFAEARAQWVSLSVATNLVLALGDS